MIVSLGMITILLSSIELLSVEYARCALWFLWTLAAFAIILNVCF